MQKSDFWFMWLLFFCIASLQSATSIRRTTASGDEEKKSLYCALCCSDVMLLQLRKNINASKAYLPRARTLKVAYAGKTLYELTLIDIAEQQKLFDDRVKTIYGHNDTCCICIMDFMQRFDDA